MAHDGGRVVVGRRRLRVVLCFISDSLSRLVLEVQLWQRSFSEHDLQADEASWTRLVLEARHNVVSTMNLL